MERDQLLDAIEGFSSLREFVEGSLLSGIPWIFQGNKAGFDNWRTAIARETDIRAADVYLVGSAATGYSLSPRNPGRSFRPVAPGVPFASDIDIAIVDSGLFEAAWDIVLRLDRNRGLGRLLRREGDYGVGPRSEIDRMRLNIYWGTISHRHASSGTAIARVLRSLVAATTRRNPFVGHRVRTRIYRRREDLVSYHEQSLQALREALRELGAEQ